MSTDFAILPCIMASDTPASPPSGRDRREFYRITVTLPVRIQPETDTTEGALIEQSVNISGGGFGITVATVYQPNDILAVTLRLPDHGLFTSFAEVLRLDPIPFPGGTYRLHARFVRMPSQDREVLIRHILRFQRDHLQEHYSA
ncbi:MAG: PilZ domain-containing protein [Nitrospira sp.]|nr:PilZ domain-containing protein [Nitrospira sp.]